jgi:AAHS family 4-hydroxybenzoate transporter-like MFS transporter
MSVDAETVDVHRFINARPFSRYQWMILALCFLIVFIDGFNTGSVGFVAPALVQSWGTRRELLGPVLSAALVGLAIGSLTVGPVADSLGRRIVLIWAVALFGLGSLASGLAHNLDQLTLLRFLTGLGLGAAMPNAVTLMSEYSPDSRRSLFVTLMFCGLTLGSSLGGFIAAALIPRYGWPSVFFFGGVAALCLAAVLAMKLPESARYLVARRRSSAEIAAILNRIAPGAVAPTANFTLPEQLAAKAQNPVAVILSPRLWLGTVLLWIAYFMGLLIIFLLTSWMPTLMRDAGFDLRTSTIVTSLFQLGGTAGAILVGWAMDRLNPRLVLALSYALGAIFVFVVGRSLANVTVMAFAVLGAGFFISGSQTPINALAAAFYPTRARATGVSWMSGVGRAGGVLGAYIAGPLLGSGWGFQSIFAWLAVPGFIAALALVGKAWAYRSAT